MAAVTPDALFLDPDLDWQAVSPRLTTERRIGWAIPGVVGVLLIALGIFLSITGTAAWWVIGGIAAPCLVAAALGWFFFAPRTASSWRYAERDQDLLVRRGRLFKQLTVVPYGRMQVIEVRSNPIAHRLGIATVTLVTASASTDAQIPGLDQAVAHELRDRLAAKGEVTAAGL